MFNFIRNYKTMFQSGFTFLPSSQLKISVPGVLQPHQRLVLSFSLILPILLGMGTTVFQYMSFYV